MSPGVCPDSRGWGAGAGAQPVVAPAGRLRLHDHARVEHEVLPLDHAPAGKSLQVAMDAAAGLADLGHAPACAAGRALSCATNGAR